MSGLDQAIGSTATPAEHRIGRLDDFPPFQVATVEVAGRKIGVVRNGDIVYAFANRCPHHGAPMCAGKVSGTMLPSDPDQYHFALEGLVVKCPWHAYEFDLRSGESLGGVMSARLAMYHTEVRGGDVYCQLRRASAAP
jgi:nitrite reductase (NADH) small subunit